MTVLANEPKNYIVRFKPLEPYFFGNEHTFSINGNMEYFIRSETTPSQTTLLGALRFALLPHYHTNRTGYTDVEFAENSAVVGAHSFDIKEDYDFGAIKAISSIFLIDEDGCKYVPAPFDHALTCAVGKSREKNKFYTPFGDYRPVQTYDLNQDSAAERLLPIDYRDKDGIVSGYVALAESGAEIVNFPFVSVEKTGIQKLGSDEAFFKRACWHLDEKYSFAVILTLDSSVEPSKQIVYMGQQKSAFELSFEETMQTPETFIDSIKKWLISEHGNIRSLEGKSVWYAASDCLAVPEIYNDCLCAITQVRDFRCLSVRDVKSNDYSAIIKSQSLYRLICAGSFFVTESGMEIDTKLCNNSGCNRIGMNYLIKGEIKHE